MKRTRRICIEIEHRELSVSIARGTGEGVAETILSSSATIGAPTEPCPVCGASSWILLMDAVAAQREYQGKSMQEILGACDFHLHSSPSGSLWACRRSFQNVRENS
jgi:hypothetical protein